MHHLHHRHQNHLRESVWFKGTQSSIFRSFASGMSYQEHLDDFKDQPQQQQNLPAVAGFAPGLPSQETRAASEERIASDDEHRNGCPTRAMQLVHERRAGTIRYSLESSPSRFSPCSESEDEASVSDGEPGLPRRGSAAAGASQPAADNREADYHLQLNRRMAAYEEDPASSTAAWDEWLSLPRNVRQRWEERRRYLFQWTSVLFGWHFLGQVLSGWHVEALRERVRRERAAFLDTASEADSSTSASDCDTDGDASCTSAGDCDTDGDAG